MMENPATRADPGNATTAEIEGFLKVKGDKRRELFKHWGLPNGRSTAWSEIWFAMGLDSFQPKKLWGDLQEALWDAGDVATVLGYRIDTINDWCNTGIPAVYARLEETGYFYAIRLPANAVLRSKIAHRLTRPVGRPSQTKVKRFYEDFQYQAASWDKPRRAIARIEWHPGELFPRVGFIVTNARYFKLTHYQPDYCNSSGSIYGHSCQRFVH